MQKMIFKIYIHLKPTRFHQKKSKIHLYSYVCTYINVVPLSNAMTCVIQIFYSVCNIKDLNLTIFHLLASQPASQPADPVVLWL